MASDHADAVRPPNDQAPVNYCLAVQVGRCQHQSARIVCEPSAPFFDFAEINWLCFVDFGCCTPPARNDPPPFGLGEASKTRHIEQLQPARSAYSFSYSPAAYTKRSQFALSNQARTAGKSNGCRRSAQCPTTEARKIGKNARTYLFVSTRRVETADCGAA
jgi:hypothetical protein